MSFLATAIIANSPPLTFIILTAYHGEPAAFVEQSGDGKRDDTAGTEREVGVDDRSTLHVPLGQCRVKTGPEAPQEDGACGVGGGVSEQC